MTGERFLEPITVGVIFEPPARVRPSWFIWSGRRIKVLQTHHSWSDREGMATLYHFSVTDGTDTFHLVMNSRTQSWHLDSVQLPA